MKHILSREGRFLMNDFIDFLDRFNDFWCRFNDYLDIADQFDTPDYFDYEDNIYDLPRM